MSSHNLFGLVNHLQHLETAFSDILLEAATKISALTDVGIFILVETPQGRKYSGKRHLCERFKTAGLAPAPTDIECQVDLGVSALRQQVGGVDVGAAVAIDDDDDSPISSALCIQNYPPARRLPGGSGKRSSLDSDFPAPSKAKRRKESGDPGVEFSSSSAVDHRLKEEIVEAIDDDDDVGVVYMQTPLDSSVDARHEPLAGEGVVGPLDDDASFSFGTLFPGMIEDGCRISPVQQPEDGLAGSRFIPIPPKTVEKMKALGAMSPDDVLQKDGVGSKVLNSVIYDLSKETLQLCLGLGIDSPKDFRSKQLLMDNFDKWFSVNLRHIVTSPITVKTGRDNSSAVAYMKSIARKYLYSSFKGRKT